MREFDVIVIGAGPVGENVAQYATQDSGLSACLVEAELVGGECSYYACMPSKALLRPVTVRDAAAHLGGLSAPELDRDALLARRDYWVSHYDDAGQVSWAEGAGLEVIRGRGRVVGDKRVEVARPDGGTAQLRARYAVVIATGSEPVVPDPFAGIEAWGSRDATGVVEVPGELVIVGGGVVAVEAATWMRALGSDVTLLVRGERLLAGQEPFAGEAVAQALREAGVRIEFGADVTAAERADARATGLGRVHGGRVTLTTSVGTVAADEVLLATGRRPRVDGLGLDSVPSDAPWLHRVGDASGHAPLTHWGKYEARLLGARIAAEAAGRPVPQPPSYVPVPQVIFTDPEVASVGMTEAAARKAGIDVQVARQPLTAAAGVGLLRDDAAGEACLIIDAARRVLVGATFVGPETAELAHAATVAIVGQVPVEVLRHAVPSYPTASEIWLRLLESLPRKE